MNNACGGQFLCTTICRCFTCIRIHKCFLHSSLSPVSVPQRSARVRPVRVLCASPHAASPPPSIPHHPGPVALGGSSIRRFPRENSPTASAGAGAEFRRRRVEMRPPHRQIQMKYSRLGNTAGTTHESRSVAGFVDFRHKRKVDSAADGTDYTYKVQVG